MVLETLKTFRIFDVLGDIIVNNVEDINKDRKSSRWVFPTFPDSDTNYPTITIKLLPTNYLDDSAGDYLCEELKDDGVFYEYFYKKAETDVTIFVFTG